MTSNVDFEGVGRRIRKMYRHNYGAEGMQDFPGYKEENMGAAFT